jgi:cell division protein FtsN
LQAASFREKSDAEKLRARLGLKGFSSITQAREVKGKGVYYRVRLGPYSDKRKAKTVKNKLQRLGVRPFVYSAKK